MKYIYPFILLLIIGCNTTKYIPISNTEKTIYRDSIIYINDTIEIKVPYEVEKNISLPTDTSYLKTSIAQSIAYIDTTNNKLYHSLTQNGNLTTNIDTTFTVKLIEKLVEKEIPIKVEIIKYRYDTFFWLLFAYFALSILLILLKIFVIK